MVATMARDGSERPDISLFIVDLHRACQGIAGRIVNDWQIHIGIPRQACLLYCLEPVPD